MVLISKQQFTAADTAGRISQAAFLLKGHNSCKNLLNVPFIQNVATALCLVIKFWKFW